MQSALVPMSGYHTYIVGLAQRLTPQATVPLKVLDYGCGPGNVVKIALDEGLNAYGVDIFYHGGDARHLADKTGLLGTRILELKDGEKIPAPDSDFDIVLAHQVFEHIDDFSVPLSEIDRVLKPGGIFVNIFPSYCCWREGHIGIPFSHWMTPGRLRYWYTFALRSIGLGYFKGDMDADELGHVTGPKTALSRHQWTKRSLAWIDAWTHYKSQADIERQFARYFSIQNYEADCLIYRIERHRWLRPLAFLLRARRVQPLTAFVGNRLGSHVFVLRKTNSLGSA